MDEQNLEMVVKLDYITHRWDKKLKEHTEQPHGYFYRTAFKCNSDEIVGRQITMLYPVNNLFPAITRELKKRGAKDDATVLDINKPCYWEFHPPTDIEDFLWKQEKKANYVAEILSAIKEYADYALIGIGGIYKDIFDEENAWDHRLIPIIRNLGFEDLFNLSSRTGIFMKML